MLDVEAPEVPVLRLGTTTVKDSNASIESRVQSMYCRRQLFAENAEISKSSQGMILQRAILG